MTDLTTDPRVPAPLRTISRDRRHRVAVVSEHRDVRTVLQQLAREVDAARALVSTAPTSDGQLQGAEWRMRGDVLESLALCRATLADALAAVL